MAELLIDGTRAKRLYGMHAKAEDADLVYCRELIAALFGTDELQLLNSVGISLYDLIYIEKKTLSERFGKLLSGKGSTIFNEGMLYRAAIVSLLKGKNVYVCHIAEKDDYFELKAPERVSIEIENESMRLKRAAKKSEKRRRDFDPTVSRSASFEKTTLKITDRCLESAARDYNFIMRFNKEMFYLYIEENGRVLSRGHVDTIYESASMNAVFKLQNERIRAALIGLYGIAFEGLTPRELYSMDCIFSIQPNRELDNRKKRAGQQFFALMRRGDIKEIFAAAEKMGEALTKLPLPELCVSDLQSLKNSFTLYAELGAIGAAFYASRNNIKYSSVASGLNKNFNRYFTVAHRLAAYESVVVFCRDVCGAAAGGDSGLTKLKSYRRVKKLEDYARGKHLAVELDFSEDEFTDER